MSRDHYSCGSIIQNVHQAPKLLVPNWVSNNAYYTHLYNTSYLSDEVGRSIITILFRGSTNVLMSGG